MTGIARDQIQRVCFVLRVLGPKLGEYKERHASVWPEMLDALAASGWHNYSIFLDDSGLLVGYFETTDLEAAQLAMAATDVNARWQRSMSPFFENLDGVAPDAQLRFLPLIFQLESQLLEKNKNGSTP